MKSEEARLQEAQPTRSRPTAQIALLIGAAVSLAFLLYTSAKDASLFLLVLTTLWLLSPFVLLFVITRAATHWNATTRAILSIATSTLTLGIASLYGVTFLGPLRPWRFVVSLFFPPLSWAIINVAVIVVFSLPGEEDRPH